MSDLAYSSAIRPDCYASRYGSPGYGAHCQVVSVGPVRVWYSYQTPVAFAVPGVGCVVSQNVWSNTTGRHLNEIEPDKKARVPHGEFCRLWELHVAPLLEALDRMTPDTILAAFTAQRLDDAAKGAA